jgi:hypothetical protein
MASLKEALLTQSPSLELQRAAADEIARLRFELKDMQCTIAAYTALRAPSEDLVAYISTKIKEALK